MKPSTSTLMFMKRMVFTSTLCLSLAATAWPEAVRQGTGLEKEEPGKLSVLVHDFENDQAAVGLDKEKIAARVHLKLRQHGIVYEPPHTDIPGLYVYIDVVGDGCHIQLFFYRSAYYRHQGAWYTHLVQTWERHTTCVLGSRALSHPFLMATLDDMLNVFIEAYLRANEKSAGTVSR